MSSKPRHREFRANDAGALPSTRAPLAGAGAAADADLLPSADGQRDAVEHSGQVRLVLHHHVSAEKNINDDTHAEQPVILTSAHHSDAQGTTTPAALHAQGEAAVEKMKKYRTGARWRRSVATRPAACGPPPPAAAPRGRSRTRAFAPRTRSASPRGRGRGRARTAPR